MNKKTILIASLTVIVLALVFFLSYRFLDRQFRLSNIEISSSEEEPVLTSVEDKRVVGKILSQPFRYLDRGKQTYVFASQDGKYVLKFFDYRCQHSGDFPLLFPLDEDQCVTRVKQVMRGYRVAWEHDRDNTGLVYLQLAPSGEEPFLVGVYDRFGIRHPIDLATVPFVVQERAVPSREIISPLLTAGKIEEAEALFRRLKEMYISEYKQGVVDQDHNIMYNTGFIGDRPIRIDAGRLIYDEKMKDPEVYQKDLDKVFNGRVKDWLNRHFP